MKHTPFYSIGRLIRAFGYSIDGLKSAFKSEPALRLECFLAIILLPLALYLPVSLTQKALMISSLFLVMIAELINTAIEAVVDRISEKQHPLSKKAKDVASAIVMVACIHFFCVWGMILIGKYTTYW